MRIIEMLNRSMKRLTKAI